MYKYRSYMFRSSTIIRELALNLAKVIFTLEHSVKLRRYLLCSCVAACLLSLWAESFVFQFAIKNIKL